MEADPPYGVLDALPAFSRWFAGIADAVDALVRPEVRSRLQRRTRVLRVTGMLEEGLG